MTRLNWYERLLVICGVGYALLVRDARNYFVGIASSIYDTRRSSSMAVAIASKCCSLSDSELTAVEVFFRPWLLRSLF